MTETIKTLMPDIVRIFNACMRTGHFPSRWKIGKVVTIRKSQDKDPTDVASYRPICLLSVLGKVLESLVNQLLISEIGENLSGLQYGFTKGKSTEDAIVRLNKVIRDSKEKLATIIFFDIKGAFDNVWWPSVLRELKNLGCSRKMYKIIQSYLSNRKVIKEERRVRIEKRTNKGCPQESVLGPTLWNIVFNALLRMLERENCEAIAYANNLALVVEGKSRKDIEEKAQLIVNKISEWCEKYKRKLAPNKCAQLIAKGKLHGKCPPIIKIDGKRIKGTPHFKYLGVTISTKMRIEEHIRTTTEKVKQLFNRLGHVARKR